MFRSLLVVASCLVAACPPPEPERQTTVTWNRPTPPPEEREVPALPEFARREALTIEKPIAGVDVSGDPVGYVSWRLTIENKTDDAISIAWDESTAVTAAGDSLGRLIRGETKRLDLANAQPPSTVAPHARLVEAVLIEKLADNEQGMPELESTFEKFRRSPVVKRETMLEKRKQTLGFRRRLHNAEVGARVYVVVRVGNDKRTWTGAIVDTSPAEQGSALAKPDEE